jgi:hypothetical protein
MVETLSTGVVVASVVVVADKGGAVVIVVDITGDSMMIVGLVVGDRAGFPGVVEDIHPVDTQKQQIIRYTKGYTKPFRNLMLFYLSGILKMCRQGM